MPGPNPAITNFTQNVVEFSKPTGHGDSIRDPKMGQPGYDPPDYLYLVYLSFDGVSNLIVRQLVKEIRSSIKDSEEELFQEARDDTNIEARNFEDLVWDYPCYITFVIDSEDWAFYWRNNPNHDPIVFLKEKALRNNTPPPPPYDENYSFYDAVHTYVEDRDGKRHDAIRFVNYLRDQNGPLQTPQDVRYYCFEIYLEAPFARPMRPVNRITILIDPDGQNQGPPAQLLAAETEA
jgi:hypothetical protein